MLTLSCLEVRRNKNALSGKCNGFIVHLTLLELTLLDNIIYKYTKFFFPGNIIHKRYILHIMAIQPCDMPSI